MRRAGKILYKNSFLLFSLFLVLAYLPVFLPFFHLKNDLVTQNLPTRFVTSESLYSGYFPWWNPFIHFGIPMYGDMNNGFWNPVKWVIAATAGYNIWTITLEEMLYILLGGWGIYKLAREFVSKEIAILTGLAYMCNGYILGHLQHFCWITGTAFFPYLLLFFVRLNKNPTLKNYVLGSFAFFLFFASTHPGLIVGGAYFFLILVVLVIAFRKKESKQIYRPRFWLYNLVFLLCCLGVSTAIITGYFEILQYISRGEKVTGEELLLYPTTFQSYISLFVPLAVHKSSFFATDISMRNVYIGLAHLAGLLLSLKYLERKFLAASITALLFFILLASGGLFKQVFSILLPGIGFIRLNGEFTYFVVLCFLFLGTAGLQYIQKSGIAAATGILKVFQWIFLALLLVSTAFIAIDKTSFIFELSVTDSGIKEVMKTALDKLSFWDLLFIESIIQLFTIYLLQRFVKTPTNLCLVIALNFILHSWLVLPFTGVGMDSKKYVHELMTPFPKGLQAPELASINKTVYLDSTLEEKFWLVSSYSKKIGYVKEERYPVQLKTTENFFKDSVLFGFIKNQSYVFLSDRVDTPSRTAFDSSLIEVNEFGAGYIKLTVKNNEFRFITFLQNNYPHWSVKVDGNPTPHITGFKTFISAEIPKGTHVVEFTFNPKPVRNSFFITLAIIAIGIVILCVRKWRNRLVFH